LLGADLVELVQSGVAIVVATRDDELRPEIARAWGPEVSADGSTMRLCVTARPGSKTLSNLEGNGAIAATFSLPSSYRTVQIKGAVLELSAVTAAELERVREHVGSFADEAEQVGIARGMAHRLARAELVAVRFAVGELYDQTPGPKAGSRL
jgi:hypothetical protein